MPTLDGRIPMLKLPSGRFSRRPGPPGPSPGPTDRRHRPSPGAPPGGPHISEDGPRPSAAVAFLVHPGAAVVDGRRRFPAPRRRRRRGAECPLRTSHFLSRFPGRRGRNPAEEKVHAPAPPPVLPLSRVPTLIFGACQPCPSSSCFIRRPLFFSRPSSSAPSRSGAESAIP